MVALAAKGTKRAVAPGAKVVWGWFGRRLTSIVPAWGPRCISEGSTAVPRLFGPLNHISLRFKTLVNSVVVYVSVSQVTSQSVVFPRPLEACVYINNTRSRNICELCTTPTSV